MIKISQIQIKTVKELFLYSFLSFLMISFLHDHNYVLGFDSVSLNNYETSSENADYFLDSELNCIIHTYSNTIFVDFQNIKTESILFDLYVTTQKNDNLSKFTSYSTHKLRGPPIKLS